MSDGKPPEHPTHKLDQNEITQGLLKKLDTKLDDKFERVAAILDEHGEKLNHCISGLKTLNSEVEDLKQENREFREFKGQVSERLKHNSERARGASEVDSKHDSNFATVFERLDKQDATLASQNVAIAENTKTTEETAANVVAVKDAVVGVVKNPKVRFVGRVLFGLAMLYAAGKGIKVLP